MRYGVEFLPVAIPGVLSLSEFSPCFLFPSLSGLLAQLVYGFPCVSVQLHNNALDLRESLSRLGLHNNALGLRELRHDLVCITMPLVCVRLRHDLVCITMPSVCLCLLS